VKQRDERLAGMLCPVAIAVPSPPRPPRDDLRIQVRGPPVVPVRSAMAAVSFVLCLGVGGGNNLVLGSRGSGDSFLERRWHNRRRAARFSAA